MPGASSHALFATERSVTVSYKPFNFFGRGPNTEKPRLLLVNNQHQTE